ncbi:DNA polymerase III, subunit gamma and tau [Candidatus Roizmanbacteria bacterium CG_4_10_14_0_8_um_filter_39_9]|uniref:DNA polymerase III subunit gamma/tau n=1 Tax=Candidatus Roizmanbacteria bacterium CG_4_10_14_0_8_um_filter_39_9 TaxID=1974829 RepID=A0A2M7QCQ1_9BACT|nr:MAG: DNA polymerase III, subunit gamma and tau [Candidatus Roizmanbacteria bacterium CG_4_10_14_0_8_um_filter_39_9]
MYYLTYRPKTIGEIDNIEPRETIKKILASGTLPHAFLFVGQKGTGKTSTARIFAKAVNCLSNSFSKSPQPSQHPQQPQTPHNIEPCNHCSNCKSIDLSSFPDVLELDAASNRGINEVKELIKESSYLPMAGRFRVFIIDEAHMITSDGFNALLKTLEEPPSTVIFILATTNVEKLPKTIQSRCIPIEFGRAKESEIVHMLKRIAAHAKLSITDEVYGLIASHSDSSFRDGAKLLEELVMLGKTDIDAAQSHIGLRSKNNLLVILGKQTVIEALSWIEEFSKSGGGCKTLIEELLHELHDDLLALNKIGPLSRKTTLSLLEIIILMKLLQEAYSNLRSSPIETIPLEIAIVEFYNKRSVH